MRRHIPLLSLLVIGTTYGYQTYAGQHLANHPRHWQGLAALISRWRMF